MTTTTDVGVVDNATRLWRSIIRPDSAQRLVSKLFEEHGISMGESGDCEIVVHDKRLYARVLRDGSLGLGEAYMDGWWDCEHLDRLFYKILCSELYRSANLNWRRLLIILRARLTNVQSIKRAFRVGERHYDIGNEVYEAMLDKRMVYTCAYWKDADNLDDAQEAKLDLVCRKLELKPGMRVLELGCGWAGFAKYAVEHYGVEVEGYTVSTEQVALGRERCKRLPVRLHLADYREARGRYDAVVSVGLLEHVGPRNLRGYMNLVDRCLEPGGISLAHTIGGHSTSDDMDPWFERYIFPGAVLPTLEQLGGAVQDLFVVEDVHNIGPHYDPTLMTWNDRFNAAWPELNKNDRYGNEFKRMWNYYLLSCAGSFRARFTHVYQLVLTRPGTRQPGCRIT